MSTAPNICRRCKKKRSPDETEETLKYRTCKPCREIERKKKRLKKLNQLNKAGDDSTATAAAAAAAAASNPGVEQRAPTQPIGPGASGSSSGTGNAQDSMDEKIISIANQASLQSQQQTYERQTPQQQQAQAQAQQAQQAQQAAELPKKQADKDIPIDESLLKEGQSTNDQELPPTTKDDDKSHDSESQKKEEGGGGGSAAVEGNQTASQEDDKLKGEYSSDKNIFAALQNASKLINSSENKDPNADYCLYCGVLRDVNDNGRYKLCGNCVDNPLESNVCNDFGEYLNRISQGRVSDIKNLIFLKKFENNELIPDIQISTNDTSDATLNQLPPQPQASLANDQSTTTGNQQDQQQSTPADEPANNNQQQQQQQLPSVSTNLSDIMDAVTKNFINPVISASGFKFSKGSSNLSIKPFPKAIKVLYKCKQDVKTTQRNNNNKSTTSAQIDNTAASFTNIEQAPSQQQESPVVNNRKMKTENCYSNMYVSYDIYGKTLNIKYSHNTHKTYIEKLYSQDLIDIVRDQLATTNDLDEIYTRISTADFHHQKADSQALRLELANLKKPNFVRDFTSV